MLERTTILPTLSRAKLLRTVVDRSNANLNMHDEAEREELFGIFRLLTECYEPIADDVLVISAFEIHAKATLLRSGYVIHEIARPRSLSKRQRESPVHVRTLRAAAHAGELPQFKQTTVGIDTLLKNAYRKHYAVPEKASLALQEVRRRRNFVHFAEPYVWSVERELLELIEHLSAVIPPIRIRRRTHRGA